MAGKTAAPRLRCSGGIWYECSRRKVKKLNLRVRRDGSVAVSIPLRMDWAQADRFVAERAQWVQEARERARRRAARALARLARRIQRSTNKATCGPTVRDAMARISKNSTSPIRMQKFPLSV
mgnify:CR=1 FL=1